MPPSTSTTSSGPLRRWIVRLIRYRYWLLGVAVVVGVAAAVTGQRLTLDRSIENMFAPDDPILIPYRRLQRTFGRHEVILAMYADEQLTSPAGIDRLRTLGDKLRAVPGVVAAVSLLDLPGGADFEDDGRGQRFRDMFSGYTHNKELDAAGVICLVERAGVGETPRRETLRQMRAIIHEHPRGALVGEPVLIEEAFDLLERDGRRLNTWCTLLVMLTILGCFVGFKYAVYAFIIIFVAGAWSATRLPNLAVEDFLAFAIRFFGTLVGILVGLATAQAIANYNKACRSGLRRLEARRKAVQDLWQQIKACFRSVRWLVLPLAVVQLTLAMTNATLVLSGLELSMVSSMLGAIVTVVGVASVVHVMVHFQDLRRAGQGRRRALINTMDELAAPVTVAILTDGAGFAALMVSDVGPVHDFGLMMSIGSLLVLPACILLVPGVTWLTAPPHVDTGADDSLFLGKWLGRILAWSERHVMALVIGLTAITVLAIAGSRRLEVETEFTKNFRSSSAIVQAYGFVEDRFGGAGVWDLMVPASRVLDAKSLVKTITLQQEVLDDVPNLNKAISLADAMSSWFGGPKSLMRLPAFMLRTGFGAMRANDRMTKFIDTLYNTDPEDKRQWLHVLLRSPEQLGAEQKTAMIAQVEATARQQFPEAEVTGYYVLLTRLIESVLADQWKAFIVATIMVGVMIIIALRDWRLTAVTFVPNIFPSLILFGIMGWLGLRVNMGAAMIAAVSIGLSVDSSVHYTMFYQRQRRKGLSLQAALEKAQDSVGRAAVFSTLALTVGFATLCVSDFVPTIYFGVLVSLSMIGGLIGNLLVLPILIRAVDGRSPQR